MRIVRPLLGSLGVGIVIISATFVVMAIGGLVRGSETKPDVLLAMVALFLGTGVAGVMLARANFRKLTDGASVSDFEREQSVLALAESKGGRVTIPEAATHCHLSAADSRAVLDRMVVQEVADFRVTEEGVPVYVFPGFLSDKEKKAAMDL